MSDSSMVGRDLVFLCADTGAVVAVTWTGDERPALERAVVFLASGQTYWVDPASGGLRAALAVLDRRAGGRYDLRLSAQARPIAAPGRPIDRETTAGPYVPVGIDIAFEPASQPLVLAPGAPSAERVALARGTGSVAVGSVIHRVEGSAWSAAGSGGPADCRARAVFQDGSALFVSAAPSGPVAALVRNTRIRAVALQGFAVRGAESGRLGRTVSWTGDGRSPAGATAEIRDPDQRLTVTSADPAGPDRLSWSCAPFVFVRSGITGLGLVERRTRVAPPDSATAATAAEPADELPDPF
ncbi:hypothetical protein [Actinomadura sp. GTD37]|uniref:hypothetical protein n=1 Tax=Actinomadura sp. GTD37 TaxID=1778030 RepID=UPI0035C1CCFB